MGNICGKSSKDDAFSQPGRVVGSAPTQTNTTSSIPAGAQSRKVGGPARTLGGAGGSSEQNASTGGGNPADDARRKAAEAAEARANAGNKSKGKLSQQLSEQKKQTRLETLGAASAEERAHRQVQESQQTQRYD